MLDRRAFLRAAVLVAAGLPLRPRPARAAVAPLPAATIAALERSPYVYVSPLRRGGEESACHGEVWFGWIDGAVVLTTARTTWKARSAAREGARARLWVGSFGRWKRVLGRNEAFRAGPSFEARVRAVEDATLLGRLLALYETKYPDEFPGWRDRMRAGHASGERVLLRYEPVPA